MIKTVISIDPGRTKCGIAVVSSHDGVIARTIVNLDDLQLTVQLFSARFKPDAVIVGGSTGSESVIDSLSALTIPLHIVNEHLSTQQARTRYFEDHPPRGWRRLIPRGMLTPQEPYDDYAAILLAERFLDLKEANDSAADL